MIQTGPQHQPVLPAESRTRPDQSTQQRLPDTSEWMAEIRLCPQGPVREQTICIHGDDHSDKPPVTDRNLSRKPQGPRENEMQRCLTFCP